MIPVGTKVKVVSEDPYKGAVGEVYGHQDDIRPIIRFVGYDRRGFTVMFHEDHLEEVLSA